ncbi:hypothetical protein EZS27_024744 [termite gut metagenome]|uniref:Uncharacterized protein n=1 Tax=termite gut metagenome TaxID=433724 RepID=A0A5J4QYC7_9ZZZZ
MKANLVVFFDYNEKPDNEIDKTVRDLLMSFVEFCDDTDFEFQCIPRIGETIVSGDLIHKWLENKEYKKPCSDSQIWRTFYHVLKTGTFKVTDIYHSLNRCSIHCSDIEYQEIK